MRIYENTRAEYKRIYATKGCNFCDVAILKDQEVKQLSGKYWIVLACKYPYMNGNLMIVPIRHVVQTEKLTIDEWAEFSEVLIKTQKLLGDLFKTKSFNVMLHIGPNSGGSIRHLHWMIIPRPKKSNLSGWNIFENIYIVTMSYKDLMKKIKQYYKIADSR